ncbi:MAG: hypothetical protein JSV60_05440 [Desulfobacterales bacterium]|jgi:hypothetical protein|nr:MAG: hypothetical protein JSV60_05440 [Desulfobacterales bacterium]
MKRVVIYLAIAFVGFCMNVSACSKKEEVEPEKGKIDKMTDQAADAIVQKIRTPMNQARSAKQLEDERTKALDEALEEQ